MPILSAPHPIPTPELELRERLFNVFRVMHAICASQRIRWRGPSRTESALTVTVLWGVLYYLLERGPLHHFSEVLVDQFHNVQTPWTLLEALDQMFWD